MPQVKPQVKPYQMIITIFVCIQFVSTNTRTRFSCHCKLKCFLRHTPNDGLNFIFSTELLNYMECIASQSSYQSIKLNVSSFLWNHFNHHFDSNNSCTWHIICPCSSCFSLPSPLNLSSFSSADSI